MKCILTPKEIAEADRHTIEDLGIPGIELMARAGHACIEVLEKKLNKTDPVLVTAGTGNNGGDAFVMAEALLVQGYHLQVMIYGTEERIKPDARYFFERYKAKEGAYSFSKQPLDVPAGTKWIIDGLLGTGLSGPVRGTVAQWIKAINASSAKVFAIDLPSGSYPGGKPEDSIQADLCVTFQSLKPAHVISPSCFNCGELSIAEIGIQTEDSYTPSMFAIETDDCQLTPRSPNSHKGSFGTLAVLGGARGMEGASALTGLAALRIGAGKVQIYSENRDSPKFSMAALMVDSWESCTVKKITTAWVIGPGLSKNEQIHQFIEKLPLEEGPTLWDADGLFFLPDYLDRLKSGTWVMTPHPGEAAALLETTSAVIQENRLDALKRLGSRFPGGWIILKGARSMVLSPEGITFISLPGNPALAVAGSGDVLSGIIGGLLAQGFSTEQATITGLLRHGLTAEHWVQEHAEFAMLPEDMIHDLITPLKKCGSIIPTITSRKGSQFIYD